MGSLREVRCRRSISENNLPCTLRAMIDDEVPLNDAERRAETLETMRVRKEALEEALNKKMLELRTICLREGELTGVLPQEFPLRPNENAPVIRKRMRTEFTFSDRLLMKSKTKEEELLAKLELDFEIQCKIVKATCKLCNEPNMKKSIRKQRKQAYQQALAKLKDIEKNLQQVKQRIAEMRRAAERSGSSCELQVADRTDEPDRSEQFNSNETRRRPLLDNCSRSLNELPVAANSQLHSLETRRSQWAPQEPSLTDCSNGEVNAPSISAPSTPVKNRSRKFMIAAQRNSQTECISERPLPSPNCSHTYIPLSPSFARRLHTSKLRRNDSDEVFKRPNSALCRGDLARDPRGSSRLSDNASPEYDTISSNASSFGSTHNLPNSNYLHRLIGRRPVQHNEYEQLSELSVPEAEAKKVFGVPTRRSAIALNSSQDDLNMARSQERFGLQGQQSSSSVCSQNETATFKTQKTHSSINMAQRPLPPPPVESSGNLSAKSSNSSLNQLPIVNLAHLSHVTTRRKDKRYPPPLNLCNVAENQSHGSFPSHQYSSHTASITGLPAGQLLGSQSSHQSASGCLLHGRAASQPSCSLSHVSSSQGASSLAPITSPISHYDESAINSITDQLLMGLPMGNSKTELDTQIRSVRSSVIRTPLSLTIGTTTSSDNQPSNHQPHSPAPSLPPRTPITSTRPVSSLFSNSGTSINSLYPVPCTSVQPLSCEHANSSSSLISSVSCSLNSMHSNSSLGHSASAFSTHSHNSSVNSFNLQNSVLNLLANNTALLKDKKNLWKPAKGWTETTLDQESPPVTRRKPAGHVLASVKAMDMVLPTHTLESDNKTKAGSIPPPAPPKPVIVPSNSLSNTSSVLQPFREEVKPYELSDFYKYSQKHRKKAAAEIVEKKDNMEQINGQMNSLALNGGRHSCADDSNEMIPERDLNYTLNEASFMIKTQVAEAFSDEMNAWYEEKYKTATLV